MSGKKSVAKVLVLAFAVAWGIGGVVGVRLARAQGPARGPSDNHRDEAMEISSKHNLEVAKWYLTKRKAYEGARDRLQEIIDSYPDFSRMDEVVYLLGEAYDKLGKKAKAVDTYEKVVKTYPDSEFAKKASERIDQLKGK